MYAQFVYIHIYNYTICSNAAKQALISPYKLYEHDYQGLLSTAGERWVYCTNEEELFMFN